MILIGVGANLPSPRHGPPRATCGAALAAMADAGLIVRRRSRWYRSAPVPASHQPWFVNGVAEIETALTPPRALAALLTIEGRLGRRRQVRNEPRIVDLDLLDYDAMVSTPGNGVELPHPRLHERAFVLLPLAELARHWRHPLTGTGIAELIKALPADQAAEPMVDAAGAFGTEWTSI
ncbi:MAG TPA: 2-amino-4-hydroxy-6-hydroxymethyldihydropteridine diphosphokinase [Rhodospirillales bacterium]|nr:2-amino-4-hydroxy-6-hydroxymethyldihydropteridine diphosphokinase [Rhodospirillales bacterium]